MRRHLTGVSKSLSLVLLIQLTAAANSYAYSQRVEFDDFPATSFGCAFEAKDLGERLKAYGLTVRSAKCERESAYYGTYYLSATFDRPNDYKTENTYAHGDNFYGRGWYKDLAECEAELPQQVRLFQLATGLDPYISYCSKKGASYSKYPYWPYIEALGKADLHLNAAELSFSYSAEVDTKKLEKEITENFKKGVRQLVYSLPEKDSLSIGYYGFSQESPSISMPLRFFVQEDCVENLETIKAIYAAEKNPPIAMVCAKAVNSTQSVLTAVVAGTTGVRVDGYYDYWKTQEECLKNLPSAVADVQTSGLEVLGAVCGYYYGYYMPYTFHRR